MPLFGSSKAPRPLPTKPRPTGTSKSGRRTVDRAELLCEWKCCGCGAPKSQLCGIQAGDECLQCRHTRCIDQCEIKHFGLWVKAKTVVKLAGGPGSPPTLQILPLSGSRSEKKAQRHKEGKQGEREGKAIGGSVGDAAGTLTRLAGSCAPGGTDPGVVVCAAPGRRGSVTLQVNITNNYGDGHGVQPGGPGIGSGGGGSGSSSRRGICSSTASIPGAAGSRTKSTNVTSMPTPCAPSTVGGRDAYCHQGPQSAILGGAVGSFVSGVQQAPPYSQVGGSPVPGRAGSGVSEARSSSSRASVASKAASASWGPSGASEARSTSSRRSAASKAASQVCQGRRTAPSEADSSYSKNRAASPAACQLSQGRGAASSEAESSYSKNHAASQAASQVSQRRSTASSEAGSSYRKNLAASQAASQINQSRGMPPPSLAGSTCSKNTAASDDRSRISGRQWKELGTVVPEDSVSCAGRRTMAASRAPNGRSSTRSGLSSPSAVSQPSTCSRSTAVPSDGSQGSLPMDVRIVVGSSRATGSTINSSSVSTSLASGCTTRNAASASWVSSSTI